MEAFVGGHHWHYMLMRCFFHNPINMARFKEEQIGKIIEERPEALSVKDSGIQISMHPDFSIIIEVDWLLSKMVESKKCWQSMGTKSLQRDLLL